MPSKLRLHMIGRVPSAKSVKRHRRKVTAARMELEFKLNKTIHAMARIETRTTLSEEEILADILGGLHNVHRCLTHGDVRLIGVKYTYHFGYDNLALITLYPNNKKERQDRKKYHRRIPIVGDELRHLFLSKQ